MTDKEVKGKLRISGFLQMPSSKCTVASSGYYKGMFTHLFPKERKNIYISASEILQKKINRLYYIFPIDFAMAKSYTCACLPATRVPRVASTAI